MENDVDGTLRPALTDLTKTHREESRGSWTLQLGSSPDKDCLLLYPKKR